MLRIRQLKESSNFFAAPLSRLFVGNWSAKIRSTTPSCLKLFIKSVTFGMQIPFARRWINARIANCTLQWIYPLRVPCEWVKSWGCLGRMSILKIKILPLTTLTSILTPSWRGRQSKPLKHSEKRTSTTFLPLSCLTPVRGWSWRSPKQIPVFVRYGCRKQWRTFFVIGARLRMS